MRLVGCDGSQALQAFCGSRLVSFKGGLFNWMGGQLRAVDPATGTKQWGLTLDAPPLGADVAPGEAAAFPPAVAGGTLFVATRGGELLRVDPTAGAITGRVSLGAPAASQPVIDRGRVLVGTTGGELVCIDTGNPKLTGWNQWGGDATHSGVAELAAVGGDHRPGLKDAFQASEEAASPAPTPQELKAALKAFGKQLLRAQLKEQSHSGAHSASGGHHGITPPEQFSQAVWDELVRQGKLRSAGEGKYELGKK